jgi:hypothetical protein
VDAVFEPVAGQLDIAAQYTAERDYDATVSTCAFGPSLLIFGFASLLRMVA